LAELDCCLHSKRQRQCFIASGLFVFGSGRSRPEHTVPWIRCRPEAALALAVQTRFLSDDMH
jgi:hypothetical protein